MFNPDNEEVTVNSSELLELISGLKAKDPKSENQPEGTLVLAVFFFLFFFFFFPFTSCSLDQTDFRKGDDCLCK